MFVSPQNFYVKISSVIALKGRLDHVVRSWGQSPHWTDEDTLKETPRELPCPFLYVGTQQEGTINEP